MGAVAAGRWVLGARMSRGYEASRAEEAGFVARPRRGAAYRKSRFRQPFGHFGSAQSRGSAQLRVVASQCGDLPESAGAGRSYFDPSTLKFRRIVDAFGIDRGGALG